MLSRVIPGDERGIAIIIVAFLLVVIAILGGAMVGQTAQDNRLAYRTYKDQEALYLAESAKERAYQLVYDDSDFPNYAQPGETNDGELNNVPMPGGTYSLKVEQLSPPPNLTIKIHAYGDAGLERRREITVVAVSSLEHINIWDNAIFAGKGQTDGVIAGNSRIHGSVHILGENVGEGNSAIEAIDMTGNSWIHNNYGEIGVQNQGMPAELYAKIDPLPQNGEVYTLDAKLRVKNGAVGLSGTATIGEEIDPTYTLNGETVKATGAMDGIYIETDPTDTRWTGTAVTDGIPDENQVESLNGVDKLYDLGDQVVMPLVPDPYHGYGSYDAYFKKFALQIPAEALPGGTLTLDNTNSATVAMENYYLTHPESGVIFAADGTNGFILTKQVKDEYGFDQTYTFGYNPSKDRNTAGLQINGMIAVDGQLVMDYPPAKGNIVYDGKGTIYAAGNGSTPEDTGTVPGDIHINANLLPLTRFPSDDAIGLVAKNDMYVGEAAKVMMAGAFYGQNTVTSDFQNEIAGTIVGSFFHIHNVPNIYQVKTLKDNLPPGIIGADDIVQIQGFDERSWKVDLES